MTEKPDYMQKAREILKDEYAHNALAHTLEALDTERAAHEATKAELLALREGVAQIVRETTNVSRELDNYADCIASVNSHARSILPQPAVDPLVEAFREIHGQDIIEGEEWSVGIARRLNEALTRHGLTITAIGGKP